MNCNKFPPYYDYVAQNYLRLGIKSYTTTKKLRQGNIKIMKALNKTDHDVEETKKQVKRKMDTFRRRADLDN